VEELLKRKLDILEKWTEMTNSVELVDETSAQAYLRLVEEREKMLIELKDIDKQLEPYPFISSKLAHTVKDAAKTALESERRITENLNRVVEPLKRNIRNTKEQRSINNAYSAHLAAGMESFYDRRK
jgi:gas vesicle protein